MGKIRVIIFVMMLVFSSNVVMHAEGYKTFGENSTYTFSVEEETASVEVTNKNTNETITSKVDDVSTMNGIWANFATSGVTIEASDPNAKVDKYSSANPAYKKSYTYNENQVVIDIDFSKIEMQVVYTVTEDGLEVSIPSDKIVENDEEMLLTSVYVLPFLGANNSTSSDGYMFVPSGSGALIGFDQGGKQITTPYVQAIYGNDMGYQNKTAENIEVKELDHVGYPVYGMVKTEGELGYFGNVTSGAEYTNVVAYPARLTTPYNFVTQEFKYRDKYFQKINRKGDGSLKFPKEIYQYNASVVYNFEEEASYSQFAEEYERYLVENKMLDNDYTPSETIPYVLAFFGFTESNSILNKETIKMTSDEQLNTIITDLANNQITEIDAVMTNYNNGGASGLDASSDLSHKFISSRSLTDLDESNDSLDVYLEQHYEMSNKSTGLDASNEELSFIYNSYDKYLRNPTDVISSLEKESDFKKAMNKPFSNPYSFKDKGVAITRSEVIENIKSLELEKTLLTTPDAYAYDKASIYQGMQTSTVRYSGTTQEVPFIPLVLSNHMQLNSDYYNQTATGDDKMLKLVEYNLNPAFLLTYEDPNLLIKSDVMMYSSQYDVWEAEIIKVNEYMNEYYSKTKGKNLVSNQQFDDFAINTYDDGTQVYINYSDQFKVIENNEVAPNNYVVRGINE